MTFQFLTIILLGVDDEVLDIPDAPDKPEKKKKREGTELRTVIGVP